LTDFKPVAEKYLRCVSNMCASRDMGILSNPINIQFHILLEEIAKYHFIYLFQ